jgi:hypothetical protein
MSDMKTFTIRDISRKTADVFHAVDAEGGAHVVARDGRSYIIQPETHRKTQPGDFDAIRRKLFVGKKVPHGALERGEAQAREER